MREHVAHGWELLCAARRSCAPAEYAEAKHAYERGAEAWCVALRAALAIGLLPAIDTDPSAACPYPARSARAWWWAQAYADADACWVRALRRTGGDRVGVGRE